MTLTVTESPPSLRVLSLAGMEWAVSCDFPLPPPFRQFVSPGRKMPALTLTVLIPPALDPPGPLRYREGALIFWTRKGDDCIGLLDEDGSLIGKLICDRDWRTIRVLIRRAADHPAVLRILTEVFFRTNLVRNGSGLVLHAAGLSVRGRGLALLGPSGRGKSTQARLWESHRMALVLNEDRPAVTLEKGGPLLHGTPWSGSSPVNRPGAAPLSALVFLEQAPENEATLLSPAQALPLLLPRLFLPYGFPDAMPGALSLAEGILRGTRLIRLRCRPDHEAVDALEQALPPPS